MMLTNPPVLYAKALVGAFSVIVKTDCETDGSFHSTRGDNETVTPAGDKWRVGRQQRI